MSPTADPTTDALAETPVGPEAPDEPEAPDVTERVAGGRADPDAAGSRTGGARGRLRAAVVVVGLAVAAASGSWLSAYAAPEQLDPVVRVDATDATDAPADASPDRFCDAYGLPRGLDGDASVVSRTNLLRGQAPALVETGTPGDIPGAARDGFEVYAVLSGTVTPTQVEALGDGQGGSLDGRELDGQGLQRELGLDADEASRLSAFVKYAAATCFSTPGAPSR